MPFVTMHTSCQLHTLSPQIRSECGITLGYMGPLGSAPPGVSGTYEVACDNVTERLYACHYSIDIEDMCSLLQELMSVRESG